MGCPTPQNGSFWHVGLTSESKNLHLYYDVYTVNVQLTKYCQNIPFDEITEIYNCRIPTSLV